MHHATRSVNTGDFHVPRAAMDLHLMSSCAAARPLHAPSTRDPLSAHSLSCAHRAYFASSRIVCIAAGPIALY
jgi:hypothetical protein